MFNPFQPLEKVKPYVQVLRGLDHQHAEPGPDWAGDHARGGGTFLTGVRVRKSATDIRAGVSIDQAIAREVGHQTRFPSLELSCDSVARTGACDSGASARAGAAARAGRNCSGSRYPCASAVTRTPK